LKERRAWERGWTNTTPHDTISYHTTPLKWDEHIEKIYALIQAFSLILITVLHYGAVVANNYLINKYFKIVRQE
jgi:hypothetical protein